MANRLQPKSTKVQFAAAGSCVVVDSVALVTAEREKPLYSWLKRHRFRGKLLVIQPISFQPLQKSFL